MKFSEVFGDPYPGQGRTLLTLEYEVDDAHFKQCETFPARFKRQLVIVEVWPPNNLLCQALITGKDSPRLKREREGHISAVVQLLITPL